MATKKTSTGITTLIVIGITILLNIALVYFPDYLMLGDSLRYGQMAIFLTIFSVYFYLLDRYVLLDFDILETLKQNSNFGLFCIAIAIIMHGIFTAQ